MGKDPSPTASVTLGQLRESRTLYRLENQGKAVENYRLYGLH